jgi:hypothetical protein
LKKHSWPSASSSTGEIASSSLLKIIPMLNARKNQDVHSIKANNEK